MTRFNGWFFLKGLICNQSYIVQVSLKRFMFDMLNGAYILFSRDISILSFNVAKGLGKKAFLHFNQKYEEIATKLLMLGLSLHIFLL